LKNKGLKNERMTKVGLYAIDKSTTLESNKSQALKQGDKFLNGHACLSDNGTKEPAFDVAGMIGDRYRALSVGMLVVVV
jgi:hypothetical protein